MRQARLAARICKRGSYPALDPARARKSERLNEGEAFGLRHSTFVIRHSFTECSFLPGCVFYNGDPAPAARPPFLTRDRRMALTYIVRHGAMRFLGEYTAREGETYARGS